MTDTQDDMELVELMLDRGDDVGVLGAFEALKASADRRVEEEREACATLLEAWAQDEALPVSAALRSAASAIRSRSNATGEDKPKTLAEMVADSVNRPVGDFAGRASEWFSDPKVKAYIRNNHQRVKSGAPLKPTGAGANPTTASGEGEV